MTRAAGGSNREFARALRRFYLLYTIGFILFLLTLAALEQLGLRRLWIGYIFFFATIALYAGIGIMSRTGDLAEYYVAGRRVPAVFNGMATAADWMSAASFIGLAGGLYLQGFDGLAFILGWTGGYCLVAFLLAPYLRQFGQFTIPDFLGARYGGNVARAIGIFSVMICSFTYVVAQIYGVGIITSRFTGVEFTIGIFLGLASILVCSFLGGMRAVTWTQVAQYVILIVAYLSPVVWLSIKYTGNPVPQLAYGRVLEQVTEREKRLSADPRELEVRGIFAQRAAQAKARVDNLPQSWEAGRAAAEKRLTTLRKLNAPLPEQRDAEIALAAYPKTPDEARDRWTAQVGTNLARAAPPAPHAEPYFSGNPNAAEAQKERDSKRRNFLALAFCLMVGTAGLPHILMRYYTTPSVDQTRKSVFWSLFFISLLYVTAPALAVLVKFDIYSFIVGKHFAELPAWVAAWQKVDPHLLSIIDVNKDGIVQLAEIVIGQDIVVLATPEIAGLPYVVSGLVAAGGLAAALSTADGLLLTIANALSHDWYFKMINPAASTQRRITLSKVILLVVAIAAAAVAAQKPADILFLVSASFSLAASAFFVPLVAGIFWKRANQWGTLAAMVGGVGVTCYYMVTTHPWLRDVFRVSGTIAERTWFDIAPISAGVFGMPVAAVLMIGVSRATARPDAATRDFIDRVRCPDPDTPTPSADKS